MESSLISQGPSFARTGLQSFSTSTGSCDPTSPMAGVDHSRAAVDCSRWDAVVIGAGVAGSVAARELALAGHRVLIVDKHRFPRRKVCGACLSAGSLQILDQIGLKPEVSALGGQLLSQFTLGHCSQSISLPIPEGLALSREVLDLALVNAAVKAGATFQPEAIAALGPCTHSGREIRLKHFENETCVRAHAVIVASGLGGMITEESSEWTTKVTESSRIGIGCVIDCSGEEFSSGTIWMAAGIGGYVGLVGIEGNRLNVAAALDRSWLRQCGSPAAATEHLLREAGFPVPKQLDVAGWQGTVPLSRYTTPVATHHTFLIGDAASYVEPFTGEGMRWALLSGQHVARWAANAIADPDSSAAACDGWCREYRSLIQNRQRLCHVATGVLRSTHLLKMGMTAFAIWPRLARHFVTRINA